MSALPEDLVAALRTLAARRRILVACDFDGCLAPFVLDPADARPLPAARRCLVRLAGDRSTSVALVSGRTLASLRHVASPPPRALLVGSHGAEFDLSGAPDVGSDDLGQGGAGPGGGGQDARAADLLGRVTRALTAIVDAHPGTTLEFKPTAVVLHTRGADRELARAATTQALAGPASWGGVHTLRGKEVVEISVSRATKGIAVRHLRAAVGLSDAGGVLYVGDDATDERAFAVLDDDAGDVTVKVGEGDTVARHRVPDPPAVARLLGELAALRRC